MSTKFYYTSDDVISAVKRSAFIPSSQGTFQESDFLAFMNEEMAMGIVPSVIRLHEDHLLWTDSVPLVANQTKYNIPYRAIGNKLREVAFRDTNGNIFEMTRIGIGDLPFYNGPQTYGRVYVYYIANNQICLVPDSLAQSTGTTMLVSYYIRPNSLVLLKNVAPITAINRTTGEITVSNIPTEFSTLLTFDFIKAKSPHRSLGIDKSMIGINSLTKILTFSLSDIPSDLDVGDHVCLATESAIPQIPSDLHAMLVQRVVRRCLEALGDTEGLSSSTMKLSELEKGTNTLIDNRVEDSCQKVVNRHAILRRGLYSRRYRYRG